MPELSGQNIPDLGNLNGDKPAPKIGGFPPMIMIRHLDEDGAMTPETTRYSTQTGPDGQVQVQAQQVIGRKNIVTAEDLVEMITTKMVQAYWDLKDLAWDAAEHRTCPKCGYMGFMEKEKQDDDR